MYAIRVYTTTCLSADSSLTINIESNTFLGTFSKGDREFIEVNSALHFNYKNNTFDSTFQNSVENIDYLITIKSTCETISSSYTQLITISQNGFNGLTEINNPFLIAFDSFDVNTDRSSK